MSAQWRDYALHLHHVLEQIGAKVSPCGAGEEQDCGNDHAHHCMSYLAALNAKANDGLLHVHHSDPDGEQIATELYERWSHVFTSEGHRLTS